MENKGLYVWFAIQQQKNYPKSRKVDMYMGILDS